MATEPKGSPLARLLAAAIPVTLRTDELEQDPGAAGQGYRIERLVDDCKRLRAVVRDLLKSAGSSGPTLPP